VRNNAELFEGLESAAIVGIPVPVDRVLEKPTEDLVALLASRRIPFAYVPLGGAESPYRADVARLQRFKVLVTVNPDEDFLADDLKAFTASGVDRKTPEALRTSLLDELQPFFVAPGGESLRIMPRAAPGDRDRVVLHVIDASRGDVEMTDPSCRRRIGISRSALDPRAIESARWIEPERTIKIDVESSPQGSFISLPGCPLWGIVELRLRG
jgi:hypothetical protein